MTQKLFCFGLGYTAKYLIQALKQQKTPWQFAGSYRTNPLADVDCHFYDGSMALPDAALAGITHMLISLPPRADSILNLHDQDVTKHLKWLGYLSTTAIYGDHKGGWVDEDTPPAPSTDRGRARLKAEQQWQGISPRPAHIFRLGSIYGPARGHLHNILTGKQKKIQQPGQYFSRIHVDDIARALISSMNAPKAGRVYNLVDDEPSNTPEVLDHICDLLGRPHLPPLALQDAHASSLMKSFYSENKRVRNDRMKRELGLTLKYPDYREGFKALIADL